MGMGSIVKGFKAVVRGRRRRTTAVASVGGSGIGVVIGLGWRGEMLGGAGRGNERRVDGDVELSRGLAERGRRIVGGGVLLRGCF